MHLAKAIYDYYRSGADDEHTLRENQQAYSRLQIRPRVLINVSQVELGITLLDSHLAHPICVAPTAMQKMAHHLGEIATAQACSSSGTCMVLSSLSTSTIEEVASKVPNSIRWFQLYVYRDRALTARLVDRAERNGYRALVLTVDTPILGQRWADVRNNFSLPNHLKLANFEQRDEFQMDKACLTSTSQIAATPSHKQPSMEFQPSNLNEPAVLAGSGLAHHARHLFDQSLTWKDIDWLRSITKLPILIKGILTAEDAQIAVKHQVQGIIVSNHGARQLDGVPATISVLEEIVTAVQPHIHNNLLHVFVDGGIRRGTDVFKVHYALPSNSRSVFLFKELLSLRRWLWVRVLYLLEDQSFGD